jgi:hypothetical protein
LKRDKDDSSKRDRSGGAGEHFGVMVSTRG